MIKVADTTKEHLYLVISSKFGKMGPRSVLPNGTSGALDKCKICLERLLEYDVLCLAEILHMFITCAPRPVTIVDYDAGEEDSDVTYAGDVYWASRRSLFAGYLISSVQNMPGKKTQKNIDIY
ncbi:unnamed protein product [Protopolystoma xenopodis]|uniref:Uncharacterized protein n=1 Tax=Protopolystoma xenopodis TaxID=117903 RepID=A0A3S5FH51_9PLAT|nr:unnamed protein product [Protopolystoma xenopodis]